MSKILTPVIVREELEKDGIIFGLQGEDAMKFLLDKWGGKLDTKSNWAEGHEDLIIYTEASADGYDLWICTDDHNGPRNINEDIYYYQDNETFMERTLDCLRCGGSVWIDSYIAEDMEYEIDSGWTYAYEDEFSDMFDEKKDELLNSGDYDDYKE